jgi:hypothetical protein
MGEKSVFRSSGIQLAKEFGLTKAIKWNMIAAGNVTVYIQMETGF